MRWADITGAGFQHIAGLKSLERLEIRDSSIDDEGMASLANLDNLTLLDLTECRLFTDDGLKHIAGLSSLRNLDLAETKISNDGIAHLAGLTGLENLSIRSTSLDNDAVSTIAGLKNLQQLNIGGTLIDGDGARKLVEALPELKVLNLANSDAVRDYDLLDELADEHPDLDVIENDL
jgi:Leucine-rich repeat (LRR) protein